MEIDYKKEGKIAIFTLNRPDAMNSFSVKLLKELYAAMVDFRDDPDLWVGIVTGAGDKSFSAGADIKELFPYWKEHKADPWSVPLAPMHRFELYKPLVAAINGYALAGGMELALACDIRIASETARFGQTEVRWGVLPAAGATWKLPRTIPWCKAAEMNLMGRMIDAQEAYRLGLVNKVVPQAEVMPTARQWAEELCQMAPLAVRAAKEAMLRGTTLDKEEGARLEHALFTYCLETQDLAEGRAAFIEKRKPVWKAK
ncbi:MAG: enoyl-CoA hydratase/isomerase family protein [Chloroflexi bacterium]|nr:enoyl-CoA hydratase/isomerase family protein [Chloroflexota bacterium]